MLKHISFPKLLPLLPLFFLLLGLLVVLQLLKEQQTYRGKASTVPSESFQFSNTSGQPLSRTGDTITTDSLNIHIDLSNPEALENP